MHPEPEWSRPPGWPAGEPAHLPSAGLPAPPRERWGLAVALFVATFFSTTTLGANWILAARTDVVSPIPNYPFFGVVLSPATIRMVWSSRELLTTGLSFSLPVLFIMLCHELGHYVYCRRYGIAATLPYFVPAPFGLGTLGAFIRIRSLIRNKRELFDVGIAGPIAGFLALMPFLVYGIARSEPVPIVLAKPNDPVMVLQLPGSSLLTELLTRAFHGPLPAGTVLNLHPFALAAWVGLLVTALNLLPLAQLDGGHILYAVVGERQRKVALPLWLLLVAAGFIHPVWFLWALIVGLIGLRHPPVEDARTPLDRGRLVLALIALAILVLCFMPVPLQDILVQL